MATQNKFKIITPSYNNAEWIEYNIASILNQTYTNYEVLYIDDASTDDTYSRVFDIVGKLPNWKVVRNPANIGAARNYFENLSTFVDGDDIVIHLDGDDWFYDEFVLENINKFYNEKDCWMSYGGFIGWDGTEEPIPPYPQNTEYPEFVHKHKKYRLDMWRASHLRTYRAFLIKALPLDAIKDIKTKEYYWHASDLAFQFPLMEMCSKDKIGVFDFHTCVYNQSKSNTIRTRERESVDNTRYEIEIRNRKHYKEDLTGTTLPQINIFPIDYYHEYCNIPTKFTFCYDQVDGEFDMTIVCDPAILKYIKGEIVIERKAPVVARLLEQREYFHCEIYNAILDNYDKFDEVWTFDRELLKRIPNAKFYPPTEVTQFNMLPNPQGHPPYKSNLFDTFELPDDAFQIYPKSKLVSAIVSAKAFLPGHVKRLEFIRSIQHKIDWFGRGTGRELPSKIDGLRDYMFSVAIENVSCDDNYFSEKIIDCFLTGTIPIYHGCIHIGEFFDARGILTFSTQQELRDIINNLSYEKYQSMLEYAHINFKKCFDWALTNDMMFDMYAKNVIEKNGSTI
jgi:glycosyltransferase involved in cell wall biosynthesis